MEQLQKELEVQRRYKINKAEYENVAKVINGFPSQETSQQKIRQCLEERDKYELKSKDEEILRNQKWLHFFVSMIQDKKNEIATDKLLIEERERATALKQSRIANPDQVQEEEDNKI